MPSLYTGQVCNTPHPCFAGDCIVYRHAVVAGVGALGIEVAKNLGLLGCECVLLVDPDVLEPKNLGRSILLQEAASVGQAKVSQAVERFERLLPRTQWTAAAVEIADLDPDIFARTDIVFSCVDTDLARTEIAALAVRYKVAVIDGGLGGTSTRVGRVSWFPPTESAACFACLLSGRRRAELLSMWESDVHSCWAQTHENQGGWRSSPTMASLVAALQVELAGVEKTRETASYTVRIDLDRSPLSERVEHRQSRNCPLHEVPPGILFPICTLAECAACGRQFQPHRRIAWVRRHGMCPGCGSRDLIVCQRVHDAVFESAS
jgi:adenylyltransferase/sulfurtransferase